MEPPPAGYRRVLDIRHGLLERSLLWKGAEGGVVRFRFRRLASMEQPHLVALEVVAEALTDPVDLTMATGIDTTVGSPSDPAWRTDEVELLDLGQLQVGATIGGRLAPFGGGDVDMGQRRRGGDRPHRGA